MNKIGLCDDCCMKLYGTKWPPFEELCVVSMTCGGCKRTAGRGGFRTYRSQEISIMGEKDGSLE